MWQRVLLLLTITAFVGVEAAAQLRNNTVVYFQNVGNSGYSMISSSGSYVSIAKTDKTDYNQLWYVSKAGTGFRLRNLGTGLYLRSSNRTSEPWTLVNGDELDGNCTFNAQSVGGGYALRATNYTDGYGYMHYADTRGGVVCWESGNSASQWKITRETTITEEDLEANWAETDNLNPTQTVIKGWEAALAALCTDKACSELNETYASYTKAQMIEDENYKALPEALQNMVLKLTTDGTWAEDNVDAKKPGWDAEYAKRLRVQLIEPYNNKESAAQALRMQAHTNLNNPLGIYANARQVLYIMVEGEIKDGATLYLPTWTGHGKPGNGYMDGVKLREGLNVVPLFDNLTTGCFNYVVQTFYTSQGYGNKARSNKLSDYEDLKIHVEGGILNGFFNVAGDELWGEGDDNADWDYYAKRATHTDVTVLGKYMTLQFPLHASEVSENQPGLDYYFTGKNIARQIAETWDNVMLWERMLMGVASKEAVAAENARVKSPYSDKDEVFAFNGDNEGDPLACDYGDYYNVHGLAFGVGGSTYMYGSWDHSGYNFNTMGSVMSDILKSAGSHWGPGHEIGHQHQQPFTLNGLTEVTNNLFSNVVLWYYGESTSRYNGDQGSLTNVYNAFKQPNGDFYTNNIWALTHMYYKLFMYYHVLGHNTEFYPRLYELLRQEPMTGGYNVDGATGLLHFYKQTCRAAGEDLTEFFRAYGILSVMKDRFVGDYSNSIYNTSKAQIDAAIKEVKSWGYKENYAALFVNDGTGELIKSHKGDYLDFYGESTVCAEMGSYASFDKPATKGTISFTSGKLRVTATGGVGIAIRNEKGEFIAFSDMKAFELSDEVAYMLMNEQAKVEIVNPDNTFFECSESSTFKKNLLKALVTRAQAMVKLSDDTNTKVGYYRSSVLADLKEKTDAANAICNANKKDQFVEAYEALYAEITKLLSNPSTMIGIIPGSSYLVTNARTSTASMSLNATSKALIGATTNTADEKQHWIFESAGSADTYYLKNKATGTYLDAIPDGKQGSATAAKGTVAYKMISLGNGVMALQCQDDNARSLNYNTSMGVIGWSYEGDEGSHWMITAVELDNSALNKKELEELIAKTNDLLNEMGDDVMLPGAMPLQTEVAEDGFYLTSNADQNVVGNGTDGGGVAALLDGNTTTYMHTQWSGTPVGEAHYVQVDLGEGRAIADFQFSYATRKASSAGSTSPAPTTIEVYGSVDGKDFATPIVTFEGTSDNPLPGYNDMGATWTSANIVTEQAYRYLRFTVTASAGPGANSYGGYAFFAMSEFSLINPNIVVNSLKAPFAGAEVAYEAAAEEVAESTIVAENQASTDDEVVAALEELRAKYEALLAAYNSGITGVDAIVAPVNKMEGIYDLSGRRLQQITKPGFYIVNGKKQFVK